jgi:hypothetical protein
MILTQSYRDLGTNPAWLPVGVYTDELDITDANGNGLSFPQHVQALEERAKDFVVLNAKFEAKPSKRAHPSYDRINVRVVGDLYVRLRKGENEQDVPSVFDSPGDFGVSGESK